jgi:hypothetical protein
MIVDESLGNIDRTVRMLRKQQPDFDARPAIIAAPQWWLDEIKKAFADKLQSPDDEISEIHECKVVLRTDIDEPFTIAADGRLFPVLPDWARRANRGLTQ